MPAPVVELLTTAAVLGGLFLVEALVLHHGKHANLLDRAFARGFPRPAHSVVVRFHSRPELVGTWSEGIIALDPAGGIAALDRNALFQLGNRAVGDLINAPLERVFNISLPALLGRSRKKSFHPLPIYEARHGGRPSIRGPPDCLARHLAAAARAGLFNGSPRDHVCGGRTP